MLDIQSHIVGLLFEKKQVCIPGFGTFTAEDLGVSLSKTSDVSVLEPPSRRFRFSHNPAIKSDTVSGSFARLSSLSTKDAESQLAFWIKKIQYILQNEGTYDIEKIGRFIQDKKGAVSFQAREKMNFNADAYGLATLRAAALKGKSSFHQQNETETASKVDEPAVFPEIEMKTSTSRKRDLLDWALPILMLILAFLLIFQFFKADRPIAELKPFSYLFQKNESTAASTDEVENVNEPQDSSAEPAESAATTEPQEPQSGQPAEPETESPTEAKNDIEKAPRGYHAVVGAFKNENNAFRLAESLRKDGLRAHVIKDDKGFFRATIHLEGSKAEAENELRTIRKQQNSGAWMFRH